ncbi:MAG: hypothetical protein ABSG46_02705 [Candidatus Binataceae bacterium]|jgi:hypothetical protein
MPDFRKQFGLDYLRGSERSDSSVKSAQSPADAFLDDALLAYGRPMLEQLSRSPQGTARLYSLIDALQIPIEAALKVAEELDARGRLNIVEKGLEGQSRASNHQCWPQISELIVRPKGESDVACFRRPSP